MTAIPVTDADREAALLVIYPTSGEASPDARERIAQAIARARAEEREACAVLCEALDSCETDLGWTHCPERYAAAIRARDEGAASERAKLSALREVALKDLANIEAALAEDRARGEQEGK